MYGKSGLRLCRSGAHIWAVAYCLLQIALPCFADFTQSDSSHLSDIATDVDVIRGLLNTQQGDVGAIADSLSSLLTAWDNSIPYIKADTAYIPSAASTLEDIEHILRYHLGGDSPGDTAVYATLRNIEANTEATAETVIDIKDDLVLSISNGVALALASVPLCYNFATNFSSGVDLGIVTNTLLNSLFLTASNFASDFGDPANQLFTSFLQWIFQWDYATTSDAAFAYLTTSQTGFLHALLMSALRGSGSALWSQPYNYWFGGPDSPLSTSYLIYDADQRLDFDYTIFDAYNTLGLGVLTNQAASLISIAHANTNLLTRILGVLNDEEHGLKALAIASANSYASISNALGSAEGAELNHRVSYEMPEWEPTYSGYADSNTNHVDWEYALGRMTYNAFGNTTNQIHDVASSIGDIASSDLSLSFDFSGFQLTSAGPIGGWSVLAALTDDSTIAEAKDLFSAMSSFMFYVLDLCIVVQGCRRIQRAIIGDVGIV